MRFYVYDLETSGLDPKWARIMQFAGQMCDEDFNPIGEPDNWIVKLSNDVLPEPGAIMVTGITPQKTIEEGMSEPEFLQEVNEKVFKPKTTVLGFNSIRFDDEFMRYSLYRNFYDPYEREWSDDRSRWDIIDLVRMTRALRPSEIKWPVDMNGKPTNRLELITKENGVDHYAAHDALSDVLATIEVAKLIKAKQPKLYAHLLSMKDKKMVKKFLDDNKGKPFVYTTGSFTSNHLNTSVVIAIGVHPTNPNGVIVYDLRVSPERFKGMSKDELSRLAFSRAKDLKEGEERLPVQTLHINKSPAIAPVAVLDKESEERIKLTISQVKLHMKELKSMGDFVDKTKAVIEDRPDFEETEDVDGQLYSSFIPNNDRNKMQQVRNLSVDDLTDFNPGFSDDRLNELLFRYKARNYPQSLSKEEEAKWEQYRSNRLIKGQGAPINMSKYMEMLNKLSREESTDKNKMFILEELKLYAESIAPFENEALL